MGRVLLLSLAVVGLAGMSAYGQGAGAGGFAKAPTTGERGDMGPKEPEGVAFEQKLNAAVPLGLTFYDHDNKPVVLKDLVGAKPTVLCLGYYRCPKLCNQVQTGLLDALRDARQADPTFVAGGPFNVVIVSIDPRESSQALARPKRLEYLKNYDQRNPEAPGWWFLTANHGQGTDIPDADRTIHKLADAVGFTYTLRARQKVYEFDRASGEWVGQLNRDPLPELPRDYDYNHASGVVLVTPDGHVSSYLLGINYSASDLRTGLVMASGNQIGTFFERNVSQYCQVYDAVKGHYKPTMKYVAYVFTPVMLGVVYMVYLTIRRSLREVPLELPKPSSPTAV